MKSAGKSKQVDIRQLEAQLVLTSCLCNPTINRVLSSSNPGKTVRNDHTRSMGLGTEAVV